MGAFFFRCVVIYSVVTFNFLHCMQISVDTVNPICQGENEYNNFRAVYSSCAMQTFLSQNILVAPTVACCLSGGGYRAMISSTAFLHALEHIGLLGAVKYVTSLSGSTWALSHMLVRDSLRSEPLTMQQFSQILKMNVSNVPFFNPRTFHWANILEKMAQVYTETRTVQPADFWGALLTDRMMYDLQHVGVAVQNITFEVIRNFLKRSLKYPFPIFTASIDDFLPYQWMEVNPFVSGGDYLMAKDMASVPVHYSGAYIPTSAFGSGFMNGTSCQMVNEKSVGSMMGIFGSPYSVSVADVLKFAGQEMAHYLDRGALERLIYWLTEYICRREHLNMPRFLPTHISNFLYEMDSILKERPKIIVSDAGFDTNLPILSLLKRERKVDVILICDASSDSNWKEHPEISQARDLAYKHGFKFPSLCSGHVINENLIIYEDPDPSVPTIVYFVNSVHESTLKFDYTADEFDELYGFMYHLVESGKNILQSVILSKLKQNATEDFVVICPASSEMPDQRAADAGQGPKGSGHGACAIL
jgi:hypothetical protein